MRLTGPQRVLHAAVLFLAAVATDYGVVSGSDASNTAAAASYTQSRTSVNKVPLVDKRDIRFARLSSGGEPFRKWVIAIAQDRRGFLWLGTDDGLYRYDGYKVIAYRHDPNNPQTLSDNTVKVIYRDREGILWIGTGFGGLDRFDPERDAFTHYRHDSRDSRSLGEQTVTCIYQDYVGSLWVGTVNGLDRLDAGGRGFSHYSFDDNAVSHSITALYEDRRGNFWVGTTTGLYRLDRERGRLTRFPNDRIVSQHDGPEYIGTIMEDHSGVLWIGSPIGNGLSTLDVKSGRFTHYMFNSERPGSPRVAGVNAIREDRNGVLWIGTLRDGLLRFDRDRRSFRRYFTDANITSAETIETLFEDAEENIWVGSHDGVIRFQTSPSPFVTYAHEPNDAQSLHDNTVWSVYADRSGSLWIGTAAGLHHVDRKTGRMTLYRHNPKDPNSLSNDAVSAIAEDSSGGLWIGTHGGGVDHLDLSSGRFTNYQHNAKDLNSLSTDLVQCVLVDHRGVLWVGTHNAGLNRFDQRSGRFKTYRNNPSDARTLSEDNVRVLYEDRTGSLWIGTNHGLNRLDPGSEHFIVYLHDPNIPTSLSHNSIGAIYEDRHHVLWIGTRRGLDRFDRANGTFKTFTTQDGLADDSVESIREDRQGDLWLATHLGLSEFHPSARTVHNYSESDGLPGNYVNPNGTDRSCVTPDGEMVFGSNYGVTVFDPARISINSHVPSVVLTELLLFNKPVLPASHSPLRQPIWATESITLDHTQSIFTLEFAALSFVAPERNRYRYKLEGLEDHWNEVDSSRRIATYTNLPAGKYMFRVQGSNNDLRWNDAGASLAIAVLPPWWETWWFRAVAGLCVAGLVLGVYRYRVKYLSLTAERLELLVRDRTRELKAAKDAADAANRAKSAFLAHMSHELRTPLNAILLVCELFHAEGKSEEEQRENIGLISRSGEHLLTLINDVLDLAKIEAGKEELVIARCDLRLIVHDVTEMMLLRANERHLAFSCFCPDEFPRYVRTDAAKLRQVLINLLGNAVKFTNAGSVTLRASSSARGEKQLRLRFEVEDTGVGISPEDQTRIFEPFVQVGESAAQKGTGLGLTITRRFVDMMGGTIAIQSAPGQGSRFTVELPAGLAPESEVADTQVDGAHRFALEAGQPEWRILIVEDNLENATLLQQMLCRTGFRVRVAPDGVRGIEIYEQWHPQLIWMDLEMPKMTGQEAARRIRNLEGGKGVKIVAVTASAFTSEREQILAAGLDDFLCKPYRADEIFECMSRHLDVRYQSVAAADNGVIQQARA